MKKMVKAIGIALVSIGLVGCSSGNSNHTGKSNQIDVNHLEKANYKSGDSAIVKINNDKSNLDTKTWKGDRIQYANLDHLNRTAAGNTAYLDKNNVASSSNRQRQTVYPSGWHQKFIDNKPIINRGHLIAYSVSGKINVDGRYDTSVQSGDQNNLKNLFTQSAFSNQKLQTIYEGKVRDALRQGKKVIYQVQPIFNGKDKMAKGVHMQAISTDKKLNFNVYLYNVQPGVKFNYATGRANVDKGMNVPTPKESPKFNDNKNYRSGNHHYVRHAARDYAIYKGVQHIHRKHNEHKYNNYNGFHRTRSYHHFR